MFSANTDVWFTVKQGHESQNECTGVEQSKMHRNTTNQLPFLLPQTAEVASVGVANPCDGEKNKGT